MRRFALAVLAVGFFSCGDMRAGMVGNYAGTSVMTITIAGEAQTTSDASTVGITHGADPEEITLGGSCAMVGKVTTDDSFTIQPKTCPPVTSSACVYTFSVTQGSGTFTGPNLAFNWAGTVAAACTGAAPATGTISVSANGARK